MATNLSVYVNPQLHTCIRTSEAGGKVALIRLGTDGVAVVSEKLPLKEFEREYTPAPEYPVRRAAQLYLFHGERRVISSQARETLGQIVRNPATAYDAERLTNPPKLTLKDLPIMSTRSKKKAAEPAAEPAKKTKAAATPAAAKKTAKTETAPVAGRGRAPLEATLQYSTDHDGNVKRGFVREFADAAKALGAKGKKFQLSALLESFADQPRAKLMDSYYDCVRHGALVVV